MIGSSRLAHPHAPYAQPSNVPALRARAVPITEKDINEIAREVRPLVNEALQSMRKLKESEQRLPELLRQKTELEAKMAACDEKYRYGQALIAEGRQGLLEVEKKKAEIAQQEAYAAKLVQESVQLRQNAVQLRQDAAAKKLRAICQAFYKICNSKAPFPEEKINEIFEKYLKDQSVTTTADGLALQINSMSSTIKYLQDNPTVRACDFRVFKGQINDLESLEKYLCSSTNNVRTLAFKKELSDQNKKLLESLVIKKAGMLKVQYFD